MRDIIVNELNDKYTIITNVEKIERLTTIYDDIEIETIHFTLFNEKYNQTIKTRLRVEELIFTTNDGITYRFNVNDIVSYADYDLFDDIKSNEKFIGINEETISIKVL